VTVFAIPAPARALLTQAAAPLVQCLDAVGRDDALVLGGGTALAARWQHRQSTDIDLWLPDTLFFQHQAHLVELLQKTFQVHAHIQERDDGTRTLAGITPEGEFTIGTVPPLLPAIIPSAVAAERDAEWGIRLEPVAETLAKKLRWRMAQNDTIVARDLYDIVTASREDPVALDQALGTLARSMRLDIADRIVEIGPSANQAGRPLTGVHRPDWQRDLVALAVPLIADGPNLPPPSPIQSTADPEDDDVRDR